MNSKKRKNDLRGDRRTLIKSPKIFGIKFITIKITLIFLILVSYRSYNYANNTIDYQTIPYLKKTDICYIMKSNENDGLVFLNQDKKIYENFSGSKRYREQKKRKPEIIIEGFSHEEIIDIVKNINNST